MLTRRQLLLSAAVIGMPVAAAIPLPSMPHGNLRLGLLQSRQPFIDPHDIAGSRERALSAYRLLIRTSLEEQGSLDWLTGGAFPLSGPGPFTRPVMEQLALTEDSPEVQSLKSLAQAQRIKLTLGGWWRETGNGVAYRQLTFDSRGEFRALLPAEQWSSERMQLHLPAHLGKSSLPDFAAECGRLHRYGAWVEMPQGPATPPGAPAAMFGGSAVVGPDGGLIAHTDTPTESCLAAELG